MSFTSIEFVILFLITASLYFVLDRKGQNVVLLIASLIFYGWWDFRFLFLMVGTAAVDFFSAIVIHQSSSAATKRWMLTLSVVYNLSILAFFKYFHFLTEAVSQFIPQAGLTHFADSLNIILPVGISFYTFQSMSYTIDVYRGQLQPCRKFHEYLAYLSFFPQLVAGPIERASHMLSQFERPRRVTYDFVTQGGLLVLIGVFKKVGVADSMAPSIDMLFGSPSAFSGAALLIALGMFSVQIYCDFSGYSDIARGIANLLGFDLMVNFEQPYFSTSITEFWRRWHISLSQWLRDYLYIPLGGNRYGTFMTYRNLLLTMLLGGLWHGASWCFVIWGGLHGLYLCLNKLVMGWSFMRSERWNQPAFRLLGGIVTYVLVCIAWVFFRSGTLASAVAYLQGIATWKRGEFFFSSFELARFGLLIAVVLFIDSQQYRAKSQVPFLAWRPALRLPFYCFLLALLFVLGGLGESVPFIYFQF